VFVSEASGRKILFFTLSSTVLCSMCMMPFSDSGEVSVPSKACSDRKDRFMSFVFLLQMHVSRVSC